MDFLRLGKEALAEYLKYDRNDKNDQSRREVPLELRSDGEGFWLAPRGEQRGERIASVDDPAIVREVLEKGE
jgi:hypothetical protein